MVKLAGGDFGVARALRRDRVLERWRAFAGVITSSPQAPGARIGEHRAACLSPLRAVCAAAVSAALAATGLLERRAS